MPYFPSRLMSFNVTFASSALFFLHIFYQFSWILRSFLLVVGLHRYFHIVKISRTLAVESSVCDCTSRCVLSYFGFVILTFSSILDTYSSVWKYKCGSNTIASAFAQNNSNKLDVHLYIGQIGHWTMDLNHSCFLIFFFVSLKFYSDVCTI